MNLRLDGVEQSRHLIGRRAVLLSQQRFEVGESCRRAIVESQRLLDFEVFDHLPVADAALILNRHQRQKAQQLPGATSGFGFRERRGAKAGQQRINLRPRGIVSGAVVVCTGGCQRRERTVKLICCLAPALLLILARQQTIVARCQAGFFSPPQPEGFAIQLIGVGERAVQLRLISIEEVSADGG